MGSGSTALPPDIQFPPQPPPDLGPSSAEILANLPQMATQPVTAGYAGDISSPAAMDMQPPQGQVPGSLPPGSMPQQQAPDLGPSAQETLAGFPRQGTQPQQPHPLTPILNDLVSRYQAMQPKPGPPPTGVKGLLTNFFQGGGRAAMVHVGLPTPEMQQQNLLMQIHTVQAAITSDQLSRSETAMREAQIANMTRPLSQSEAQAIGEPQLAGQIVPADVISAASQELNRQQTAKIAGLEQPTIQLPLDQTTARLAGIPDSFVGKTLTPGDWRLVDARLQAVGYQKQDMGFDGAKGGIWLMDRAGNQIKQLTPISESARATALVKMQLGAMKQPVYAYDPTSNQTILTTQAAAQAGGMNSIRSVKETDISKDLHDTRVLNDIASKANQVFQSSSAMDDKSLASTVGAARYLSDHPNSTWDQMVQAGIMGNMPQPVQNYMQDVMSLRESAMGLQKVLTGSARSNETQLNALLRTLPSLEPNSATVKSKLQRFTQNVTLLRQGIPRMPGIDVVPIQGGQASPISNPNASFSWGNYPVAQPR